MRWISTIAVLVSLFALVGCKATHFGYAEPGELAPLSVAFADAKWTGGAVPADEVCKKFGGANSASPRLNVSGIPSGANALLIEYNDLSYPALSSNGGHGAVLFTLPGAVANVTVPSVPAQTMEVPQGFTMVKKSGGDWPGLTNGAYLPPCSGGRGNTYAAIVYAVNTQSKTVLAVGRITLGRY